MLLNVSDRIHMVPSGTRFTFCNCLRIDDDIRGVVDTGAANEFIAELEPESVDVVLYTHHHIDHTRGNNWFHNADIYIHSLDYEPLTGMKAFEHYNSLDLWQELMPEIDYQKARIDFGVFTDQITDVTWKVDKSFEDQQTLDFGRTRVQVIHTPGHSAGHCAFWFPEEDFLFTGDICLTKVGPWYGEAYASPDDMLYSIDRLIDLHPARVTSSHVNEVYEDGVKRLIEFKNRIYKRDERIYQYLKYHPDNVNGIAQHHCIYQIHPSPWVLFWEKLMVIKHLNRLKSLNLVQEYEKGIFSTS